VAGRDVFECRLWIIRNFRLNSSGRLAVFRRGRPFFFRPRQHQVLPIDGQSLLRVPPGSSPSASRWHLTGQARNASNKRDVTTLRQLSSGSDKPRQLGSLQIKGCRRSTSKPSVFGTDQAISEIGSRILPDEKSLLDGWLILTGQHRRTCSTNAATQVNGWRRFSQRRYFPCRGALIGHRYIADKIRPRIGQLGTLRPTVSV